MRHVPLDIPRVDCGIGEDNKIVDNKGILDPHTLPAFEERHEPFSSRLDRIASGIMYLLLYAGLIWLAVIGIFSRYDVTR